MSGIHKFLTRRDRRRQGKEENSPNVSLPIFRGLFEKQATAEENQEHQRKTRLIEAKIRGMGISGLEERHFNYALHATKEDTDQAVTLLLLLEDSIEGIIRTYKPSTKLLGAENRQGVTCYLDALLFAMFARLDCFEAILYKSFNDEPRRKLVTLLRLWVNLLRSGKLITADMTKHIQDALAECGWEDAAKLQQQDTSEAFTFITEKLELPLLTLKMDIYHFGKEDASGDHKFINERLLEVAIPPEPTDGRTITLEDCLEAYFNNRIEVKRYLERRNTLGSTRSFESLSTTKGFASHVEEVGSTPRLSPVQSVQSNSPRIGRLGSWSSFSEFNESLSSGRRLSRKDSLVRERFVPNSSDSPSSSDQDPFTSDNSQRGNYRKEVMMPAWQFFSLIPWYTDNTPTSDAQVAAHFSSKRPILGICLKRYSFLPNGTSVRLNTFVDIPTEIGLPHFIQDDNMDSNAPIYGNFKLSLQSIVCHRGNSVDSGHYIAIVRGTSPVPPGSSDGTGPISCEAPKHWMRFDDLAKERVTLIDIEQALKTESPYLLFYQILPIDQDASMANYQHKPSSSDASGSTLDGDMTEFARKLSNLSAEDKLDTGLFEDISSARPSVEITGPDNGAPASRNSERPSSVLFSEINLPPPPTARSMPSSSPRLTPMDEDGGKGFPFGRRGSRTTKSSTGSRAGSQSGENRIGATFSRFAGRLSKDRFTIDSDDESTTVDMENAMHEDGKLEPPVESRDNKFGRGRTKDRVLKGKNKEKSKEKTRNPDRECVVM
ncbi:uncharacterized protein N7483_001076 [Penicillium malachiteum]|uniref:uncharacterized protein n=1 Tax=Penicillium malachiteum TaxID=1324776 RepID=UPI00254812E5|nr:uncharacterized protein N7483_001076 [Penicillium malachiteum]KAJ5735951.1 hypothetical protein N7483_001076 [Penicillium malachiteum]